MAWNEAAITNAGLELLTESVMGGGIEITSAEGGENVSPAASLLALKDLGEPKHGLQVARVEKIKNGFTVNVRVQNNGLEEGYRIRQIGLKARIADSGKEPVLLAVIQDADGEDVPGEADNTEFLLEYDFVIPTSNGENISVSVSPDTFATLDDVEEMSLHIGDNVRHTTAEERSRWDGKAEGSHVHETATQSGNGFMSAADKTKLDGIAASANNYALPAASANVRGGVKIGYAANGKNYPVQLSNEQMFVNVPWTDTNTTYAAATQAANGLMTAADKKKLDGIAASANNYALPAAAANVRGGVKIGYAANGKNYPVQLSNEQMFVNVPWTDTNTTYAAATQAANGLMTAADKKKLDGIAASANNYSHPTTAGNKHIPAGGSSGQILRWSASGTAVWGADNNTTYGAATQSANGLMTAADKKKLDGFKLSGINATYGSVSDIAASQNPTPVIVTIPHKVDLVFAWAANWSHEQCSVSIATTAYPTLSCSGVSATFKNDKSLTSATLTFTYAKNCYYAAFQLS